jgi:hypothetical protein
MFTIGGIRRHHVSSARSGNTVAAAAAISLPRLMGDGLKAAVARKGRGTKTALLESSTENRELQVLPISSKQSG